MRAIVARVQLALFARPSARDWLELLLAAAIFALVSAAIAFASGLLRVAPRDAFDIVRVAVIAFIAPALSEEMIFRAALIPGRNEAKPGFAWIVVSTVLFTVWHVLETWFLAGGVAFFRRFDFLALAALLGLLCGLLRWRSGSLWPPVFLHWLAAVVWIGWFGGPSLTELR